MSALRGWGLPEQHLALDALVAFVDGELTPNAHDRAAAHIAKCSACKADTAAQRQARSAMHAADTPSMSPQFLRTLQSIPTEAPLPDRPDRPEELALTEDGQLVTLNRRDVASPGKPSGTDSTTPILGSSTRLGRGRWPLGGGTPIGGDVSEQAPDHPQHLKGHGRRAKQGASVVFSGIVLGALAFMNVPAEDSDNTVTTVPRPFPHGDTARGGTIVPTSTQATTPSEPPATSLREPMREPLRESLREVPTTHGPAVPDRGTSTTPATATSPGR